MLSRDGERLTPKVLDHYDLAMLPLLWCLVPHLLTLEYLDHHQNLISSSLYYPGPLHKISSQSDYNVLSNMLSTGKQTNQRYQKHNLICQGGNKHWYFVIIHSGVRLVIVHIGILPSPTLVC